jgi:hypothetical protein
MAGLYVRAAIQVLYRSERPLSAREIWELIEQGNLMSSHSDDPVKPLRSEIGRHCEGKDWAAREGVPKYFRLVAKDRYVLITPADVALRLIRVRPSAPTVPVAPPVVPPVATGQAEAVPDTAGYVEGAAARVAVTVYERCPEARAACIRHHGWQCAVCRIDLETVYGIAGWHLIEVHHIKPLSEIRVSYQVDPVRDLVPVCPNCHAVLHRTVPPMSIDQLRRIVNRHVGRRDKG